MFCTKRLTVAVLLLAVAACGPGPGSNGGGGTDAGFGSDAGGGGGGSADAGVVGGGGGGGWGADAGVGTDGGVGGGGGGGGGTDGGVATDGGVGTDGGLTQPVRVRACNAGTVPLGQVTFTFRSANGNHLDFGTLPADGASAYQSGAGLTSCFFSIRAVINGTPEEVLGNPDCGVTISGPAPLPPGDHTWVLSATAHGGLELLGLDSPSCP